MSDPILDTALNALATNGRGLAFGDMHGDVAIPEWIDRNLPAFRAAGVTTLYMEMFYTSDQDNLNRYLAGDDSARIPLLASLQNRWTDYGGSVGTPQAYFAMVDAARAQGIRVVGLDSPMPKDDPNYERIRSGNESWTNVINADRAANPNGRYLVFVGAGHTATEAYTEAGKTGADAQIARGVDARLGIPSIDFNDYRPEGRPAPTVMAVRANGADSTFEADLPPSSNQRDNRPDRGSRATVPAAIYALPPDVQAQIDAIAKNYRVFDGGGQTNSSGTRDEESLTRRDAPGAGHGVPDNLSAGNAKGEGATR